MIDEETKRKIRARAYHFLSFDIAAETGFPSFDCLRAFVGGSYSPTDEILHNLAKRMSLEIKEPA